MDQTTAETPKLGRNPCFTNGRTTYNSYLVVAVRNDVKAYNAVGIKKLGQNQFKFHIWPNGRVLGLTGFMEENFPGQAYTRDAGLSATDYVGIVLDRANTEKFLDYIKDKETMHVAKRQHIMDVLDGKMEIETVTFNEKPGSIDFSEFGLDDDDE